MFHVRRRSIQAVAVGPKLAAQPDVFGIGRFCVLVPLGIVIRRRASHCVKDGRIVRGSGVQFGGSKGRNGRATWEAENLVMVRNFEPGVLESRPKFHS
jgi:hypothetical protein